MPLPTSTIPTFTFLETNTTPPDAVHTQSWEEPHPGRRLSYPNDKPTTWGNHIGDEGRRGGMAAEGLWPDYAADFSFAAPMMQERKFRRGRGRNIPQRLVLMDTGHTQPEVQTAPLLRPDAQQHRVDDPVGNDLEEDDAPIDFAIISPDMSGTDSDTDSSISAPPRKRIALQPLDTSFQGAHFTDFSNHLGISMDIDSSEQNSFSTAGGDAAAFNVMSPDDDLYGWNAILNRQTTRPGNETCAPYQQRRASRSKRSLLQRVFSPGGHELPPDPPTSFAEADTSLISRPQPRLSLP